MVDLTMSASALLSARRGLARTMLAGGAMAILSVAAAAQASDPCQDKVKASVVALDQAFCWNRLGAMQPQGMIYALRRDVIDVSTGKTEAQGGTLQAGNVRLRNDKRPRPLVLRMHVGDCIEIDFQNLLADPRVNKNQPNTRAAGIHGVGMQLVGSIADDGSWVGTNPRSTVDPNGQITYTLYAEREGTHLLHSTAAMTGGEGNGGSTPPGLFGAINVEPAGSTWYRSQLTEEEIEWSLHLDHPNEDPYNPGHTPQGHPILEYHATYPPGHRYAGLPILKILDGDEIVHSDLTAIIADIPPGTYGPNPVYPKRNLPFREFTIIYHDEIGAVQAFPIFEKDEFEHTLHSVRDAFAINYGTGGIGAEILANRFGVGPMWDCTDCKYEEFFLTSWAVGDPAMVVDEPANTTDPAGHLITGPKATEAFYPSDPSNTYHSYLRDHLKFRILHAGPKEHHVHHQHTHQWLHTPDSDESTYLDSQAVGPASAFTLEIAHNGSGNRNQAVGDSIFHCHFYPHFAQGMWALWRVHDVFEDGSRMLPDGEIAKGTPIPAIVPIPGIAMAPMPGAKVTIVPTDFNGDGQFDSGQVDIQPLPGQLAIGNPGYPFWVPGQAGHRPPHPPLDTIHDGGLPRHVVVSAAGSDAVHVETPFDFTKELEHITAQQLPELGDPIERIAMKFHATRFHDTFLPDGTPRTGTDGFIANGLDPVAGAPYADPCINDAGEPWGVTSDGKPKRLYKAADIQIDAIFNKSGWHFPQMRMISLWEDVEDVFNGIRPPEPLFFRANSPECIEFWLTNLVPHIYEFDDFQVRTPTDVLGQHIHLVKFDVLASDGSANGWNYEDGSFSPGEVVERILALNAFGPNGGFIDLDGNPIILQPAEHPRFPEFKGAQTTVQRWMSDDVLNLMGENRTLRTVFTHDHLGPSTHQQVGLYAGLVIEPPGSKWRDPATGNFMYTRHDGGPTSWRADILTGTNDTKSFREFMVEFGDFQLAYMEDSHPNLKSGGGPIEPLPWHVTDPRDPGEGFDAPKFAINPPGKKEVGLPFLLERPFRPLPEAVSADDPGTMSVNYRNEPVALRVFDPDAPNPSNPSLMGGQSAGIPGDLAHVFRSPVQRELNELNDAPSGWPYSNGAGPPVGSASFGAFTGDPFTPLMRAYETDEIRIRVLVGAHEEGHNFSIHGHKWLYEPSWPESGWRNSQVMGISEFFDFETDADVVKYGNKFADYLYQVGSSTDDLWTGLWGLMRVYDRDLGEVPGLLPLPNNLDGKAPDFTNAPAFEVDKRCPVNAPKKKFIVHALRAQDFLPNQRLEYNERVSSPGVPTPISIAGPLNDPTAILYVLTEDLNFLPNPWGGYGVKLKPGLESEPLILRANAGDCIDVVLANHLTGHPVDLDGFFTLPLMIDNFNANQVRPSNEVGLHTQLLEYVVTEADGANVGFNPVQTAQPQAIAPPIALDPTKVAHYRWYAGDITIQPNGHRIATPMEYGAINLISSDRIKHSNKGAIGALVIEPQGAVWTVDPGQRAAATVYPPNKPEFREFVTLWQSDVNMRFGSGQAIPNLAEAEDPEDSGQWAINYRTEPMWFRKGFKPDTPLGDTNDKVFTSVLTNAQIGGVDPETPVFTAAPGQAVRFRVLKPAGNQRNHVFSLHGHIWQELPFVTDLVVLPDDPFGSNMLGDNPKSEWKGAEMGIGPSSHYNFLLENGAGGKFAVTGDYLYRDFASFGFDGGLWGIFRVGY